jgi:hypothetical protein
VITFVTPKENLLETIVEFALPGAATALVFFILVMSVPFRNTLLRNHAYVDVLFTGMMMYMLAGTFSGSMTAAIGGITLSLLLWVSNYLFTPQEIPA